MRSKYNESTVIEEMNNIDDVDKLYQYILDFFILDDYMDIDGEIYNELDNLYDDIEMLEIDYTPEENPEINEKKLKMKEIINEAYKNGELY